MSILNLVPSELIPWESKKTLISFSSWSTVNLVEIIATKTWMFTSHRYSENIPSIFITYRWWWSLIAQFGKYLIGTTGSISNFLIILLLFSIYIDPIRYWHGHQFISLLVICSLSYWMHILQLYLLIAWLTVILFSLHELSLCNARIRMYYISYMADFQLQVTRIHRMNSLECG